MPEEAEGKMAPQRTLQKTLDIIRGVYDDVNKRVPSPDEQPYYDAAVKSGAQVLLEHVLEKVKLAEQKQS